MATDRLKIYNAALLLCGDRPLQALTENREPRFLLDNVWNDGGLQACLEQAQWHFAARSSRFDYDPAIQPAWGYRRGYPKPTDWIETYGMWQDEYFRMPLTAYADEAGVWYCDIDQIFVKYGSNDVLYGMDMSKWPVSFVDYVKAYFASQIVHKMPGSEKRIETLLGPPGAPRKGLLAQRRLIARNKAAMTGPPMFPTRGTWALARHAGYRRAYRDGGNPTSLIG